MHVEVPIAHPSASALVSRCRSSQPWLRVAAAAAAAARTTTYLLQPSSLHRLALQKLPCPPFVTVDSQKTKRPFCGVLVSLCLYPAFVACP